MSQKNFGTSLGTIQRKVMKTEGGQAQALFIASTSPNPTYNESRQTDKGSAKFGFSAKKRKDSSGKYTKRVLPDTGYRVRPLRSGTQAEFTSSETDDIRPTPIRPHRQAIGYFVRWSEICKPVLDSCESHHVIPHKIAMPTFRRAAPPLFG